MLVWKLKYVEYGGPKSPLIFLDRWIGYLKLDFRLRCTVVSNADKGIPNELNHCCCEDVLIQKKSSEHFIDREDYRYYGSIKIHWN